MSHPKVPKELMQEREQRAWEWRTRKLWTHERIARELNLIFPDKPITRIGVTAMLTRINKRYQKAMSKDVELVKTEQIATLAFVAEESLAAWARSKDASVTKRSGGAQKEGPYLEITKDQDGDPRFLAEARAALADIRKIVGADAPTNVRLGGVVATTSVTAEDLARARKAVADWETETFCQEPGDDSGGQETDEQ